MSFVSRVTPFIRRPANARRYVDQLREMVRFARESNRIEVCLCRLSDPDTALSRAVYEKFIRRRRLFPLVREKDFGAALLPIGDDLDDYLKGGVGARGQTDRLRKRRRALRLGYTFSRYEPEHHVDDILAINASMDERQGRTVRPEYLDRSKILSFHRSNGENFGVFDKDGVLAAYAVVPVCGDVALLSRLFGHGAKVQDGVMFLLITEIFQVMARRRSEAGAPRYIFYDMWFGAAPGLREFKRRLGFAPYWVKWTAEP